MRSDLTVCHPLRVFYTLSLSIIFHLDRSHRFNARQKCLYWHTRRFTLHLCRVVFWIEERMSLAQYIYTSSNLDIMFMLISDPMELNRTTTSGNATSCNYPRNPNRFSRRSLIMEPTLGSTNLISFFSHNTRAIYLKSYIIFRSKWKAASLDFGMLALIQLTTQTSHSHP